MSARVAALARGLDAEAAERFDRDGYVVFPGLLETDKCIALNACLSEVIERIGREHACGEREDDFWRQMPRSADRLEVFWAAPTADEPTPPADRYVERHVMRVGHALHLLEGPFRDAALRSPVADALLAALGAGARVVQSAVVYKQPRSDDVQFGFHQDASYLTADPPSLALAFVALDDMDADNGALIVAPRSHRLGLGECLRLGPRGFERAGGAPHPIDPASGALLELRRGDVVLLDGFTYHASDPNRSARPRRALLVHAIGAAARLLPSSWVKEPADGFRSLRGS